MALKPIYPAPEPKLPAYASVNLHDFKSPQLRSVSTPQIIRDMRMTSRNPAAGMTLSSPLTINDQAKFAGVAPLAGVSTTNRVPFPARTPQVGGTTSVTGKPGVGGVLKGIAPFASNIANMFSKPGLPPAPTSMSPVNFERVSLDGERAAAEQEARAMDVAGDRLLDGNNAVASRQATYAGKLKAFSGINSAERRENTEIANREIQVNSGIQARNNQGTDQYNRDLIDRQNVIASNRADNMANASEKFIEGKNQDALRQLDKDKLKVLSRMSPDVWSRLMDKLKKDGYDPTA